MDSFADAQARIFDLYNEGNFEEALEVATAAQSHFPTERNALVYYRVCLAARTGQPSLATWILEEAMSTGIWFGVEKLRTERDFESLQGDATFERLVTINAERQTEAARHTAPALMTVSPDGPKPPWPVVLALHGGSGTASGALPRWIAARRAGWLLALPQSSRPSSLGRYTWEAHDASAEARVADEILSHTETLARLGTTDPDRLVLGGSSAGGATSLRLALTGTIAARGVVVVVPAVSRVEAFDPHLEGAAKRGLRVAIVAGGRDSDRSEPIRRMHAMMEQAGIASRLHVDPAVAHDFPRDFDNLLPELLDWTLAAG
ncbi:MAG TPA: hypothetical protein VM841_01010 [Actinomycetota bacterium]|nr:hypothetical protein [Actinomycetota bacterium]